MKEKKDSKFTTFLSMLGVILATISLLFSVFVWINDYRENHEENLVIENVNDSEDMTFEGDCLKQNVDISLSNNSKVTTSISNITIERGDEDIFGFSHKYGNLEDINIEPGYSKQITLVLEYYPNSEQLSILNEKYKSGDIISESEWMIIKEDVRDCMYNRLLYSIKPYMKVHIFTLSDNEIVYEREDSNGYEPIPEQ